MADDVTLPATSGTVAADERTINSQTVKVQRVMETGGTSFATGQVAPTGTAGTVVAARETRKSVTIYNSGTIAVYLGPATVTTSNGVLLPPGVARTFYTTALIQGITAAGTAAVDYVESYDA